MLMEGIFDTSPEGYGLVGNAGGIARPYIKTAPAADFLRIVRVQIRITGTVPAL